jgi:hypothetical protein
LAFYRPDTVVELKERGFLMPKRFSNFVNGDQNSALIFRQFLGTLAHGLSPATKC